MKLEAKIESSKIKLEMILKNESKRCTDKAQATPKAQAQRKDAGGVEAYSNTREANVQRSMTNASNATESVIGSNVAQQLSLKATRKDRKLANVKGKKIAQKH